MGRKKIEKPKETFSTSLNPDTIKEIERLAKLVGITPSKMGSNLIEMGIDDILVLEKFGLVKIVLLADDVINKIKKKLFRGEKVEIQDIQQ